MISRKTSLIILPGISRLKRHLKEYRSHLSKEKDYSKEWLEAVYKIEIIFQLLWDGSADADKISKMLSSFYGERFNINSFNRAWNEVHEIVHQGEANES
jgi:hypothetical protein